MSDGLLVVGFLIHKDKIVTFFVHKLKWTTFYAYIFQLFANIKTAFNYTTIDNIFKSGAHKSIAFAWLYMEKFYNEIQLSIHTDTRSVFNILSINHEVIFL
ncbi:hypothetical protein SDC9_191767 [bioreactor metagenome]|uniref:Uncharacterized protein n=1 Tax=bioreactor metagenome TaxID=1076179 RepID=A0A645I032_9ZZZZ